MNELLTVAHSSAALKNWFRNELNQSSMTPAVQKFSWKTQYHIPIFNFQQTLSTLSKYGRNYVRLMPWKRPLVMPWETG